MFSRTFLALAVAGLTFSGLAAQTASPSLSGIWRLDLQKTGHHRGVPENLQLKIVQQGAIMTLTRRSTEHGHLDQQTLHYKIGPSLISVNQILGTTAASRGHWDGPTLVLETLADLGSAQYHATDHWSLSEDSKTLTLSESMQFGPRPPMQTVEIFDRQPDSSWAPDAPIQPAAKVFKNIQVLKDLPSDQLIPTMQTFTRALGVKCSFCHEPHDFPSDNLKHKKIARKMLRMVEGVDSNTFDGKPRVSCWTCHDGSKHPQHRPPVPVFSAAPVA